MGQENRSFGEYGCDLELSRDTEPEAVVREHLQGASSMSATCGTIRLRHFSLSQMCCFLNSTFILWAFHVMYFDHSAPPPISSQIYLHIPNPPPHFMSSIF